MSIKASRSVSQPVDYFIPSLPVLHLSLPTSLLHLDVFRTAAEKEIASQGEAMTAEELLSNTRQYRMVAGDGQDVCRVVVT